MSVGGDSADKPAKRRKYVPTYDDNGVRVRLKPGRKAMEYAGGSSSEIVHDQEPAHPVDVSEVDGGSLEEEVCSWC